MAKGRKSIPSNIVALRGGTAKTHRPKNDEEPIPPAVLPKCPKNLDKIAKKEWKRTAILLGSIGLLTECDMGVFAAYCESYSRWYNATLQTQKPAGMVYQKANGEPGLNPYVKIVQTALEQMLKAGALLGLNPSNRAGLKVSTPKPKGKVEEFNGRIKRGKGRR